MQWSLWCLVAYYYGDLSDPVEDIRGSFFSSGAIQAAVYRQSYACAWEPKSSNFHAPTFDAQRLAQANGGDAKEIWYNHMFEDLKYQIAYNTWVDVFKRIAKYANELTKLECPLSVEEKRTLIDSFRDMVSIPTPNTPVPTEEDIAEVEKVPPRRGQTGFEEQIRTNGFPCSDKDAERARSLGRSRRANLNGRHWTPRSKQMARNQQVWIEGELSK